MARPQNPEIERFILEHVEARPGDIGPFTAGRFGVTRATATNYLNRLVGAGVLTARGSTRARTYALKPLAHMRGMVRIDPGMEDDAVFLREILPALGGLPRDLVAICQYGFTSAVRNVFDHSGADSFGWWLHRDVRRVELGVSDNGRGALESIRSTFRFEDDRRSALELVKGGLTADPSRRAGLGLFVAARLFDRFTLASGVLRLVRDQEHDRRGRVAVTPLTAPMAGTAVTMVLAADADRSLGDVLSRYGADGGLRSRADAPVALVGGAGETLVSRSQARRLLHRLEAVSELALDFEGVEVIGPDFAHEIFAVFRTEHPGVAIEARAMNEAVARVVAAATAFGDGLKPCD